MHIGEVIGAEELLARLHAHVAGKGPRAKRLCTPSQMPGELQ
jgi:hypothetical protein